MNVAARLTPGARRLVFRAPGLSRVADVDREVPTFQAVESSAGVLVCSRFFSIPGSESHCEGVRLAGIGRFRDRGPVNADQSRIVMRVR
jgi:hypothetical protein